MDRIKFLCVWFILLCMVSPKFIFVTVYPIKSDVQSHCCQKCNDFIHIIKIHVAEEKAINCGKYLRTGEKIDCFTLFVFKIHEMLK